MDKRERVAFLRARGWRRTDADGSQTWWDPQNAGLYTLALAVRVALEDDASPIGCSPRRPQRVLDARKSSPFEPQSLMVCDGCHAPIERIAEEGHFGTCGTPARHQHHVSQPVEECLWWNEQMRFAAAVRSPGKSTVRRPCNDIRDDEDPRIAIVANAFRQARQGEPYDAWDTKGCTQDDVDRARELVETLDSLARCEVAR